VSFRNFEAFNLAMVKNKIRTYNITQNPDFMVARVLKVNLLCSSIFEATLGHNPFVYPWSISYNLEIIY
jgi:hypothetical protein